MLKVEVVKQTQHHEGVCILSQMSGRILLRYDTTTCHTTVIPQVAKAVQHYPIPGLYSGIFAMYLQNRYGSKKDPNKGNSIVFYALCLLYVLSVVMTILNLAIVVIQAVSKNDPSCSNFDSVNESCSTRS